MKKKHNTYAKKIHSLELFTCKNTKKSGVQGVKNTQSSEQIIKNLLHVLLMNSGFFSAFLPGFRKQSYF